jgi:hypothetical protein
MDRRILSGTSSNEGSRNSIAEATKAEGGERASESSGADFTGRAR